MRAKKYSIEEIKKYLSKQTSLASAGLYLTEQTMREALDAEDELDEEIPIDVVPPSKVRLKTKRKDAWDFDDEGEDYPEEDWDFEDDLEEWPEDKF